MNYIKKEVEILFQELPDNISLSFSIAGCGNKCKGCHSPHLQDRNNGEELTEEKFREYLEYYKGYITSVIFFGGELFKEDLIPLLKIAKSYNLKTCLYSGFEKIEGEIEENLDFLKTGSYREELGGIDNPKTNQKMVNLKTNEDITYKFQK